MKTKFFVCALVIQAVVALSGISAAAQASDEPVASESPSATKVKPTACEIESACDGLKRAYRRLSLARDQVQIFGTQKGLDESHIIRLLDRSKLDIVQGMDARECDFERGFETAARRVTIELGDDAAARMVANCPDGYFAFQGIEDAIQGMKRQPGIFHGERIEAIQKAREAKRMMRQELIAAECGRRSH